MSRTDKDTPWWTRESTYWQPLHLWRCRLKEIPCTLPADVLASPTSPRSGHCYWWPVTEQYPISAPPKWYVDHRYHNVQRVLVRDGCRRMAAEWRGSGEISHEVLPRQGRHSARWGW